jgi:hypothetical protein
MIVPEEDLEEWGSKASRDLYWDGILRLPWGLNEEEIDDFVHHLKARPYSSGHVPPQGDGIKRSFEEGRHLETASYDMPATVTAPHFTEFALSLTPFVERYFGEPARIYTLHSFWTRPGGEPPNTHIQEWHRDRDDRKFLALFMFGTDTGPDGAHQFVKGSQLHHDDSRRYDPDPMLLESVYGKAGSCFFANTFGFHLGLKPTTERLLSWCRWGVSNPPTSYGWDKLFPIPVKDIPLTREWPDSIKNASRLVIDWSAT